MVVLFAQVALVAALAPTARCTIDTAWRKPSPESTTVVAEYLGETETRAVDRGLRLAPGVTDTEAAGYRFRVTRVSGAEPVLEVGDTFLAVPWSYDPACRYLPFDQEEWVPAGDHGLFSFAASAEGDDAEPVFDVFGALTPYPYARPVRAQGGSTASADAWLSAEQLFELYEALPAEGTYSEVAELREALLSVFQNGPPVWASKRPGINILQQVYRMRGDPFQGDSGAPGAAVAGAPGPGSDR